ncbi:MAG: hypothetical protein IJV28_07315 [Paludibacteraceae bacterium]|nr:hypothetical protein [Paludibacteraceae bacterium]MBR1557757.1 hypothetical protein [Prevotella sp.]
MYERTKSETGQVFNCFPAGSMVWTAAGYKNIEDVTCYDHVLTHTGKYQRVIRTKKTNKFDFCKIKISGCEDFLVTSCTPFLVRKKHGFSTHEGGKSVRKSWLGDAEWVKAENLTSEYRVGIRINQNEIIPKWDGCVYSNHNSYGVTNSWVENELSQYLDNGDFWWLIGRYFGDGNITKVADEGKKQIFGVDICCAADEINEIAPIAERLGLKMRTRTQGTTSHFFLASKELWEFLAQFGFGATEKSITPFILDLPDCHLKRFVDGYLSADGHYYDDAGEWKFTTVSRNLAYGMERCILKARGVVCCITTRDNNKVILGRKVNAHKAYQLSFKGGYNEKRSQYKIEDGICWVNVRNVEKQKAVQTTCYSLTVANDESYTVSNVIVHS